MTDVLETSIDELAENFELLGDWESRFSYLIDLGKGLPPMDSTDQCEATKVQGCQAQVWMKFVPEADGQITIVADSDAFIVKGLIALLLMIYSGKKAEDILNTDGEAMEDVFAAGDAADIDGSSLPMLAEVALQKGDWLAAQLNSGDAGFARGFAYKQRASLAYLGQRDGVSAGRTDWTGASAWMAWRRGNLGWARSWRRKIWVVYSWIWVYFNGRDIARKD